MAYGFHWWVHSVLPLVFDNSLSYYEVLAKLTSYIDGLTGDVKKITDVIGTIEGIEDISQFTEYLNNINAKIGELNGLDTESKNNLVAAVNEAYELAKKAYVKPDGGIPEKDLSQELINKINSSGGSGGGTTNYQALSNLPSINGVTLFGNITGQSLGLGTYTKPSGGIPMDDLSTAVQNAIAAGGGGGGGSGESGVTDYDALTGRPQINGITLTGNKTAKQLGLGTYDLPADGIPWNQLSEDVQTRISAGGGSGGGVTDYSALTGKPSINGHVLNSGNNDLSTLGIGTYSLPAGGIPENQLNPALANKINQAYNGVNTNDTKFSGIASQLSNFTADRRYEAGELLYINGVMYKTKNVVLAGSTLVEGNNIERATVSDEIVRLNELEQKINASSNFNSFDINSEVRMNSTIETPVKVVEGINCIGGESYLINFYMENYNFQSGLLVNIKINGHLDNTVYEHSFSARDSVNVQSITFEPTDTDTYYITAEYKANNGPAIRIYMSVKYTTSQGITYIHDMLESLEGVPDDVAAAVELVEQQQQRMEDFEEEYGDIPERVETLESNVNGLSNAFNSYVNNLLKIEAGLIRVADGTFSSLDTWCYTNFVGDNIIVVGNETIKITVLAFNKETGEYIGGWNGSSFTNTYTPNGRIDLFDCCDWKAKYPDYSFKLDFNTNSNTSITPNDVYSAIDIYVRNIEEDSFLTQQTIKDITKQTPFTTGISIFNDRSSSQYINFSWNNSHFDIYASPGTYSRVFRLTTMYEYGGSSTPRDWDDGINLTPGKKYCLKSYITRGYRKDSDSNDLGVVLSVYNIGETTSLGTYEITNNTFTRWFTAPDGKINIAIYLNANNIYHCSGYVYLFDVDEESEIEPYYETEMNDTIQKVRKVATSPCAIFPVVTDIHRYKAEIQTFANMISNIKYFSERIKCDFVITTGDTIEGNKVRNISLEEAWDSMKDFLAIKTVIKYANGNHDNNAYYNSSNYFNIKDVYSGFFTVCDGDAVNFGENGTDFYFDNKEIGVRFISINSCNCKIAYNYGIGTTTSNWLSTALNTDMPVVLFTHVSPIKEHVWNNIDPSNMSDIRTTLANFVNNGGELVIITGHSHVDAEFISPYAEITNLCQKFEVANTSAPEYQAISGMVDGIRTPNRTADTYTADAWTVGVLKPIDKEIDFIRFGAGIDRYFHYHAVAPGTLTSRLNVVSWNTTDESVATVSAGVINAVGSGKCGIYAKDADGNIEIWIIEVT